MEQRESLAGSFTVRPEKYDETAVHRMFDDALARKATLSGPRLRIGTLIKRAQEGGCQLHADFNEADDLPTAEAVGLDLASAVPVYHPAGMSPREFAGPMVGHARLFPLEAISLFVALGGTGKTSFLVKIASHIAAGRPWGSDKLQKRKVLMLSAEESPEELNRKFGAAVHTWTDGQRQEAVENLRLYSCVGKDARLTRVVGRDIASTGYSGSIIAAAKLFGAEVIIIDHLQGFVSGDLNNSDTASVLAREANSIVAATGAAVVIAAHTSKANINAPDVLDGFTAGSLGFENAARQVVGVIPLSDGDAKSLGIEKVKTNIMVIGMPKNSYGPGREKGYLVREYVPSFHTVTVDPFTPVPSRSIGTARDRLKLQLYTYVKEHPHATPNMLDELAGTAGRFKASKQDVRRALVELVDDGQLQLVEASREERTTHGLPRQVRRVYRLTE